MSAEHTFAQAVQAHRAGRAGEAEALYRSALAQRVDYLEAQHNLGILLASQGRRADAIDAFGRVVALRPEHVDGWTKLGMVLKESGKFEEAAAALDKAAALRPGDGEVQIYLGDALREGGRVDDAIAAYRRALAAAGPDQVKAAAWLKLGAVLLGKNRFKESIEATNQGIALRPTDAGGYNNLSWALRGDGQTEASLEAAQKCVALRPEMVEGWRSVGLSLNALGRRGEAIDAYQLALSAGGPARPIEAGDATTWFDLGNALFLEKKPEQAVAAYRRAIELRPIYPTAYLNLGVTLRALDNPDAAIEANRQAVAQRPDFGEALMNLGNTLRDVGQLDAAVQCYRRGEELRPGDATFGSNRLFTLPFIPDFDAAAILREHRAWDRIHCEPLRGKILPHRNERSPERRLRVGYVSSDFRDHVVGRNLLPTIREHDRGIVEVFCYSNVAAPDEWTERFRAAADGWRDVRAMGDDAMARLIREDGIDILVDLTLHMAGNRLLVFARKPAPVQATFGGYPGGTGMSAMDWRLTDVYLDPPGVGDEQYVERSMRLPDSFWCYDPQAMEAPMESEAGPLPAATSGQITFGCLNYFCKVSDGTLALWARVMTAVPGSRLVMMAAAGSAREKVIARLTAAEIDAGRVEFVAFQPRQEYLRTYDRIDIGLDTLPYNGHTTSLDTLWMGVPVVTLVGQTVVGRAGFSQLSNLGLTELVAKTEEEFVEIAVGLAGDLARLGKLRRGLRERMRRSPLTDAKRFTRNIEGAYRAMWRDWYAAGA